MSEAVNLLKRAYQKTRWDYFWKNFQLPEVYMKDFTGKEVSVSPRITEMLCMPPYEGSTEFSKDDIGPLLSLIKWNNPATVLEFGTAHGATVANICAITQAQVYTVNALPDQIEGNITTFTLAQEEIGYVYRKYGFSDRVVQIYENTKNINVLDFLPEKSVDLAIIDACHDSDFVINDFLKVLPVLHSKSIVFFHDTHPSMQNHLASSYIAVMYLRRMGFNVKHLAHTWWGIWDAREPNIPRRSDINIYIVLDTLLQKILERRLGTLTPMQDAKYIAWLESIYHRKVN